jgi:hypothetical protein
MFFQTVALIIVLRYDKKQMRVPREKGIRGTG